MSSRPTSPPAAGSPGGFLSSPRGQRWLLWFSGGVFVVGLGLFLGLYVFRGHTTNNAPVQNTAPLVTQPKPSAHANHVAPSPAAIAVGRRFIQTAVARKNLAAAYSLVNSELKGGISKKQWLKGNIPVTPFKADNVATTAFIPIYSHSTQALFQLALVCRGGVQACGGQPDLTFDIGFARAGGKPNGRWLVNYWQPVYSIGIKKSAGGG